MTPLTRFLTGFLTRFSVDLWRSDRHRSTQIRTGDVGGVGGVAR